MNSPKYKILKAENEMPRAASNTTILIDYVIQRSIRFSLVIMLNIACLIQVGAQNSIDSLKQIFNQAQTETEIRQSTKQLKAQAAELLDLAFERSNEGAFNEAIEINMAALDIYKMLNDKPGIGEVYSKLSNVLFFQKEYEQGISYGLSAVEIFKETGNEESLVNAYDGLGSNYISAQEYDQAIDVLNKAVAIRRRNNQGSLRFASILNSRGNAFKNDDQLDLALADYQEAYQIVEALNHLGGMSAISANVSDIFIRQEKWNDALPFQLKSVKLMEESGFYANATENYMNLSRIYEGLEDHKNALKYLYQHNFAQDSIVSETQETATRELYTKYETEKKEATITLQNERLSRQSIVQGFGLAIIGLLGLLLFQTIRNIRNKKLANEQMTLTNNLLEKKNNENELLLKEIHHRVKNNLQTISSLLSLQSDSMDNQAAIDAVQESKNRVASMALIHQKLYQGENLASIEMRNYFETMGHAILDGFGEHGKNVELIVEMEELELDVDAAIPIGLITNELMTNALKYAFPNKKGKISLQLVQLENNLYELKIEDDGVGETETKDSTKQKGFGSLLVNLLTAQLRGNIDISNTNGTAVTIQFPPQLKSAV